MKPSNVYKQVRSIAPLLMMGVALAGCVPQTKAAEVAPQRRPMPQVPQRRPIPVPMPAPAELPPPVAVPTVSPAVVAANRALDSRIESLGRAFGGEVGIAVRDVQTGRTTTFNGTKYFPQQSVSKFWVALTALDRADRGLLDLSQRVVVKRDDLTLFHQPIRALVKGAGYSTTLEDLMVRALTQSDNTANDVLMRRAGGPEAVREFLARKEIEGVRFGPGERLLQSRIAGLEWKQSYSIGNAFYTARANLPMKVRRDALERYLDDPIDGATPTGIVDGLSRLASGTLLSPVSTQRLLGIMSSTKTGPQRLKGGLTPGWKLSHKTGTGQVLAGTSTGYNDIGLITAPDGRAFAVAVMIGRTSRPIPQRWELMQSVVRAVVDYTDALRGD